MTTRDISIEIGFEEPPGVAVPDSSMYLGGLRVLVNEEQLTVYESELAGPESEPEKQSYYDATGDSLPSAQGIRGEYIAPTVLGLLDVATDIRDTVDRFPERQIDLVQSVDALLIISFLDGESLRVAFQTDHGRVVNKETPQPPVDRALGRAVDRTAFLEAALDAGDAYLTYAEATGWHHDRTDETNTEIRSLVSGLRESIDL